MPDKIHFAIDLDGTLLEYDGWKGEYHFGEPLPGAIEWVKAAVEAGHTVTIFTSRRQHKIVASKLEEMGFPKMKVTSQKQSNFTTIIDDRAFRFSSNGWWKVNPVEDVAAQAPWWKE